MKNCLICKEEITYSPIRTKDAYEITCPRCGKYDITRTASVNFNTSYFRERQLANISGWLFENAIFEITSNNIVNLEQIKTPSFHERADKLLKQFEKETFFAGQFFDFKKYFISAGWCLHFPELEEIILFLCETGRIEKTGVLSIKIKPPGWAHLEELKKVNLNKKQCFVAMWFSEEMQQVYDTIISKAISDAGYYPHRVDLREHNGKIDDEIIAQIRSSRCVFADFTGHRGGVYFEAGFAKGMGLEVFWSCREDDLNNLHFDVRQYNCIAWRLDDLERFKVRITNRIEAVLGHGPC